MQLFGDRPDWPEYVWWLLILAMLVLGLVLEVLSGSAHSSA